MVSINIYGGKLDSISRYALLASIRLARVSGSLTFCRGPVQKELMFSTGLVVGSRSNQADDAIGPLLHSWGLINSEAYRQLQVKAGHSRVPFGQHLLAMSAIDRVTLDSVLREQVLSRVGDLFAWPDGTYMFTPGEVSEKVPPVSTGEALGAAIHRTLGTDLLRQAEGALLDQKPQPASGSPFEVVALEEPELASLLDRITGRISFRGLQGPGDTRRFWRNAFILRELGCVRFDIPPDIAALRGRKTHFDTPTADSDQRSLFLQAAQHAFVKGRKALLDRKFGEAERCFQTALTLAPDAGEYLAYLAWAKVQAQPKQRDSLEKALAMLRKAAAAVPSNPDVAYFYAGVLWLLGHRTAAYGEFSRILSLNPLHKEANLVLQKMRATHARTVSLP